MRRVIPSPLIPLAPLLFTIIATTLTLITTTSKHWTKQHYYDILSPGGGSASTWKSSLCTSYRSPFYRCGFPDVTLNDATKMSKCDATDCKWYKPFGKGKTSCQLASEYGKDSGEFSHGVVGTELECQFVHYAGNLQIAASFFITFSLLLILIFIVAHFLATRSAPAPAPASEAEVVEAEAVAGEEEVLPASAAHEKKHHHQTAHADHHSHHHKKLRIFRFHVYKSILSFLCIGAFLQFLAQFFGIIGLAVLATGPLGDVNGGNYGASTWIVDLALARYGTVAWVFALAAAGALKVSYRRGGFRKGA